MQLQPLVWRCWSFNKLRPIPPENRWSQKDLALRSETGEQLSNTKRRQRGHTHVPSCLVPPLRWAASLAFAGSHRVRIAGSLGLVAKSTRMVRACATAAGARVARFHLSGGSRLGCSPLSWRMYTRAPAIRSGLRISVLLSPRASPSSKTFRVLPPLTSTTTSANPTASKSGHGPRQQPNGWEAQHVPVPAATAALRGLCARHLRRGIAE